MAVNQNLKIKASTLPRVEKNYINLLIKFSLLYTITLSPGTYESICGGGGQRAKYNVGAPLW